MNIFISNGNRLGPFTVNEIVEQVHRNEISLETLAWRPGSSGWVPLKSLPELLDALVPPVVGNDQQPAMAHIKPDNSHFDALKWFVGPRAEKYLAKWEKLKGDRKASWNWAAWFGGPAWMFYRKMYRNGVILACLWLLFSTVEYALQIPELLGNLLFVASTLGVGLHGNYLYKRHAETEVQQVLAGKHDHLETKVRIVSAGGTSGPALLAFFMFIIAWQTIAWVVTYEQEQLPVESSSIPSEQQTPRYDRQATFDAYNKVHNQWNTSIGYPDWTLVSQKNFSEFGQQVKSKASQYRSAASKIRSVDMARVDPAVTALVFAAAEYLDFCAAYISQQGIVASYMKQFEANYSSWSAYIETALRTFSPDPFGVDQRRNDERINKLEELRQQLLTSRAELEQGAAKTRVYLEQTYNSK